MAKNKIFDRESEREKTAVLRDFGRHCYISFNPDRRFYGYSDIPNNRHFGIQAFNHHFIDSINNFDLQRQG